MGKHSPRHSASNPPDKPQKIRRRTHREDAGPQRLEPDFPVDEAAADEAAATDGSTTRRRKRKRKRRSVQVGPFRIKAPGTKQRRAAHWVVRGIVILAILFVVAVLLCIWRVYSDLGKVRSNAKTAENAMLIGNMADAQKALKTGADAASEARTITHSFVWGLPANLPFLGQPFRSVRQLTVSADIISGQVIPRAYDAVSILGTKEFRLPDGGVNLPVLEKAVPDAIEAANQANLARFEARKVEHVSWLPFLNENVDKAVSDITQMTSMAENLRKAAQVLPTVLGRDGPRTYLLIYQTNAEARGTGGFVGGAGLLRADKGSIKVDHAGTNVSLRGEFPPLDMGPDFMGLYSKFNSSGNWYNSNMSAHFPDAARIWQYLWEQKTGVRVDGVISVDPFALARVLAVTGPLQLPDGGVINSSNVVAVTEKTAYERFSPEDQDARKRFLTSIAEAAADAVTSRTENTFGAVRAMSISIGERRTAAWSSHPEEQTIIASTPISHAVPYDRIPYANVVINNGGGNKLDYYLSRSVAYTGGLCEGAQRSTQVRVRLTNNVPVGTLPPYALGSAYGDRDPYVNRSLVTFYATAFAQVKSVTVNGVPAPFTLSSEIGHPVVMNTVDTPPGRTTEILYELTEPTAQGKPQVPIQPLVQPIETTIGLPECK